MLTLEKIKQLKGNVLYITLSPFLVDNSSRLYYSDHYINEKHDVDFLSFKEYLETLKVIPGKEIDIWSWVSNNLFSLKTNAKRFMKLTNFN